MTSKLLHFIIFLCINDVLIGIIWYYTIILTFHNISRYFIIPFPWRFIPDVNPVLGLGRRNASISLRGHRQDAASQAARVGHWELIRSSGSRGDHAFGIDLGWTSHRKKDHHIQKELINPSSLGWLLTKCMCFLYPSIRNWRVRFFHGSPPRNELTGCHKARRRQRAVSKELEAFRPALLFQILSLEWLKKCLVMVLETQRWQLVHLENQQLHKKMFTNSPNKKNPELGLSDARSARSARSATAKDQAACSSNSQGTLLQKTLPAERFLCSSQVFLRP